MKTPAPCGKYCNYVSNGLFGIVLLWTTVMMEMSSSAFASARTTNSSWRRNISGRLSFKSFVASKPFTTWRSCTETWKVQTYSCIKTLQQSWEILMFPKSPRKAFSTHRRVLLIMLVLKFGKINLTTWNLISGHSAVSFMKCALSSLLSEQKTWTAYLKESLKVSTLLFHLTTRWTCAS